MSMFTLAKLTLIMLLSTPPCPLTTKLTVKQLKTETKYC